jgi:hypothetical protein
MLFGSLRHWSGGLLSTLVDCYVVSVLVKQVQLAFTTPCARARIDFADGSLKKCDQKKGTNA